MSIQTYLNRALMALALILTGPSALGAIITYEEDFSLSAFSTRIIGGIPPQNTLATVRQRIELPAFDFSLGRLTGVDLRVSSTYDRRHSIYGEDKGLFSAKSEVTARNGGNARIERTIDFFTDHPIFDRVGTFARGRALARTQSCEASTIIDSKASCADVQSDSGDINAGGRASTSGFLGNLLFDIYAETVKFDLIAETSSVLNRCVGDFCQSSSRFDWNGSIRLSYLFAPFAPPPPPPPPPVAVPEPGVPPLLLIGLGLLALLRQRAGTAG